MTTRMLIDARHREETRVAVVTGNRIEEFDFESAEHKQIKGNIYLAKVTRVEPSLQAAFVDYGGNRHGFLAFAEIHPDYYQIPKEDRDRLLAEEAAAAAEEAALLEQEENEDEEEAALIRSEAVGDEDSDLIEVESDDSIDTIDVSSGETGDENDADDAEEAENGAGEENGGDRRGRRGRGRSRGRQGKAKASDEARAKRMNIRKKYKIQDVIHRRQVLLVQVVKEERGNKGAALTTYLSLAGRYCVLMPNTSHGGGISRKISSAADRKRLKSIISDLALPSTMGCIIRTAGLARTKTEIKRDFDYLARLWDEIREKTLKGAAPELIHTDSDLIKRAIRDIYNRDISEVMVEGADGYKAAKDFMKLLMPSHAKRVQQYADPVPLFQRYGAEDQLNAMYHPIVQLKSGGYIVINPTEALVSIDINSGRSTKEHGIEATALSTNLEAAREIARQLRLRDMAGLVVIDFIDMEHHSNARKVERAMKDALKHDRARIQVGRISSFGLMEMSRQRLRTGVLEASTRQCPHCEGTGLVRTASSSALSALRLIEEEAASGHGNRITLHASQEASIYVLNNKRAELAEIEERYGVSVAIIPNGESEGAKLNVASSGPRPERPAALPPIMIEDDIDEDEGEDERYSQNDRQSDAEEGEGRRRKRRRGRRGGRGRDRDNRGDRSERESEEAAPGEDGETAETVAEAAAEGQETGEKSGRRRNRRGRGRNRDDVAKTDAGGVETEAETASEPVTAETSPEPVSETAADEGTKPKRRSRSKARAKADEAVPAAETDVNDQPAPDTAEVQKEKPKRTRRSKAKAVEDEAVTATTDATGEAEEKPAKPARKRTTKAKAESSTETASEKPKRARRSSKAKEEDAKAETALEPSAPESAAPESAAPEPSAPEAGAQAGEEKQAPRTGWWQRTFG